MPAVAIAVAGAIAVIALLVLPTALLGPEQNSLRRLHGAHVRAARAALRVVAVDRLPAPQP